VEAGLREHDSNGSRATVHQTQKPEFKLQYFKKKKKKEEGAVSTHAIPTIWEAETGRTAV
jgi:hypothetical protein